MTRTAKPSSAAERAYSHTRSLLIDTPIQTGRFITELEVSEELGVSRTPVREAFVRLANEGLLQLYPKRGAFIAPITFSEASEVMQARGLVEEYASRRWIERGAGTSDFAELRRILADQAQLARRDSAGFLDLDREFHSAIVRGAGNQVMSAMYDSLRDRQMRLGASAVSEHPGRFAQVLDEHEHIVRAMEIHDTDGLGDAIHTHLTTTLTSMFAAPRLFGDPASTPLGAG